MALLDPHVRLRIAGDGELRTAVERRIREQGLTNVRLEGRLGPERLAECYRRATAVVMPSSHEGQPLVMLEAMATGAPVVCYGLPELRETGADAIVPVEPHTPTALAAALADLLGDHPRRERLSAAASARAAAYTWPAVAATVDRLYQWICEPAG
jgi:glycosyltransferase involved in cell wall biosynthesis